MCRRDQNMIKIKTSLDILTQILHNQSRLNNVRHKNHTDSNRLLSLTLIPKFNLTTLYIGPYLTGNELYNITYLYISRLILNFHYIFSSRAYETLLNVVLKSSPALYKFLFYLRICRQDNVLPNYVDTHLNHMIKENVAM